MTITDDESHHALPSRPNVNIAKMKGKCQSPDCRRHRRRLNENFSSMHDARKSETFPKQDSSSRNCRALQIEKSSSWRDRINNLCKSLKQKSDSEFNNFSENREELMKDSDRRQKEFSSKANPNVVNFFTRGTHIDFYDKKYVRETLSDLVPSSVTLNKGKGDKKPVVESGMDTRVSKKADQDRPEGLRMWMNAPRARDNRSDNKEVAGAVAAVAAVVRAERACAAAKGRGVTGSCCQDGGRRAYRVCSCGSHSFLVEPLNNAGLRAEAEKEVEKEREVERGRRVEQGETRPRARHRSRKHHRAASGVSPGLHREAGASSRSCSDTDLEAFQRTVVAAATAAAAATGAAVGFRMRTGPPPCLACTDSMMATDETELWAIASEATEPRAAPPRAETSTKAPAETALTLAEGPADANVREAVAAEHKEDSSNCNVNVNIQLVATKGSLSARALLINETGATYEVPTHFQWVTEEGKPTIPPSFMSRSASPLKQTTSHRYIHLPTLPEMSSFSSPPQKPLVSPLLEAFTTAFPPLPRDITAARVAIPSQALPAVLSVPPSGTPSVALTRDPATVIPDIEPLVQTANCPTESFEVPPEVQTEMPLEVAAMVAVKVAAAVSPSASFTVQPIAQHSVQSNVQPNSKYNAQSIVQPIVESIIQSSIRPSAENSVHPSVEYSVHPSVQNNVQPSVQPIVNSGVQPIVQPSVQPCAQASFQPGIYPTIQSSVKSSIQPTVLSEVEPEMPLEVAAMVAATVAATVPPPNVQLSDPLRGPPTFQPNTQQSVYASADPNILPNLQPSFHSPVQPTVQKTVQQTVQHPAQPTAQPTAKPTAQPTAQLTAQPTVESTVQYTAQPTVESTVQYTAQPTVESTVQYTAQPTVESTVQYTAQPIVQSSAQSRYRYVSQFGTQPVVQPRIQPSTEPTFQYSEPPHPPQPPRPHQPSQPPSIPPGVSSGAPSTATRVLQSTPLPTDTRRIPLEHQFEARRPVVPADVSRTFLPTERPRARRVLDATTSTGEWWSPPPRARAFPRAHNTSPAPAPTPLQAPPARVASSALSASPRRAAPLSYVCRQQLRGATDSQRTFEAQTPQTNNVFRSPMRSDASMGARLGSPIAAATAAPEAQEPLPMGIPRAQLPAQWFSPPFDTLDGVWPSGLYASGYPVAGDPASLCSMSNNFSAWMPLCSGPQFAATAPMAFVPPEIDNRQSLRWMYGPVGSPFAMAPSQPLPGVTVFPQSVPSFYVPQQPLQQPNESYDPFTVRTLYAKMNENDGDSVASNQDDDRYDEDFASMALKEKLFLRTQFPSNERKSKDTAKPTFAERNTKTSSINARHREAPQKNKLQDSENKKAFKWDGRTMEYIPSPEVQAVKPLHTSSTRKRAEFSKSKQSSSIFASLKKKSSNNYNPTNTPARNLGNDTHGSENEKLCPIPDSGKAVDTLPLTRKMLEDVPNMHILFADSSTELATACEKPCKCFRLASQASNLFPSFCAGTSAGGKTVQRTTSRNEPVGSTLFSVASSNPLTTLPSPPANPSPSQSFNGTNGSRRRQRRRRSVHSLRTVLHEIRARKQDRELARVQESCDVFPKSGNEQSEPQREKSGEIAQE